MAAMPLAREIRFAAGIVRGRPFNCLVQVTNRCNMACGFCSFPRHAAAPSEELTLAEFRRLAAELDAIGTFLVSIEGGEPFLRPDLVDIVAAFGARHLPALFTSGWHVDGANARALFSAGLSAAAVSIDYPDAVRHDARRGLGGAWARAWRAVDLLRDAAPRGGRSVHVITVLMDDNWRDLECLLEQSAVRGVGHWVTLLSMKGDRRGRDGALPPGEAAARLSVLRRRHGHLRTFREYPELMENFLAGGPLPPCRAGLQSFNVDHLGNVAPCIEKIGRPAGSLRREPLSAILARLADDRSAVDGCQDCWTLCRSFGQLLGGGGTAGRLWELATRMRT